MALTKISRSLLDTGISDSSDATAITIDSSENVLIGTSSSSKNLRLQESFGIASTGALGGMAISGYSGTTAANRPLIDIQRSRGTSDESMTVVASGDYLGSIVFRGADGTDFIDGAEISARVDGTPGTTDMPTNLTFHTQADGAGGAAAERMRIDSSGNVVIGGTTAYGRLNLHGTGSTTASLTGIQESSFTSYDDNGGNAGSISGFFNFKSTTGIGGGMGIIRESASDWGTNVAFYTHPTTTSNIGDLTERMRIDSSGILFTTPTYNDTTANSANVFVGSDGRLSRSTSSRKYKNTITDATKGLAEVKTLRPVTYKSNNDGDTVFYGLIAEEVHDSGLTEFVEYNSDNEPDALRYSNMVSICIKAIQEQQEQIEALQSEINTLKGG